MLTAKLDETDTLLLLESQKFEAEYNESSTGNIDKVNNKILSSFETICTLK